MRLLLRACATHGIAASRPAALDLFGASWYADDRWRILPCGLDLRSFASVVAGCDIRSEIGLPRDAIVMGHVGRFVLAKNHTFLVKVLSEMVKLETRAYAIFFGDGPLRRDIEQEAESAGLSNRIVFAGVRHDVDRLMRDAMDVFVFPSCFEGLGLAVIEAQAAGLASVVSSAVPREAEQSNLLKWLSLDRSPREWAAEALKLAIAERHPPPDTNSWPFSIANSVAAFEGVYLRAIV